MDQKIIDILDALADITERIHPNVLDKEGLSIFKESLEEGLTIDQAQSQVIMHYLI